jgi:FKBP-type peptidyl-prolyl cis-trans isomerase FklB
MKMIGKLVVCMALAAQQAWAQAPADDARSRADAANHAEALKGGHISPRQRAELDKAAAAERNAQADPGYLAANGSKPGVVTLPSGVQYKVLVAGSGAHPGSTSTVLCRYRGAVADGATFDKSTEKAPVALKVAGLVSGLREAVRLMSPGAKWEVVVPPQLGFGKRGAQGVAPNAILVYTIELVGIQ